MEFPIIIGLVLAVLCGVPLLIGFAIGQAVERRRWIRSGASAPHIPAQHGYPTPYGQAPQHPQAAYAPQAAQSSQQAPQEDPWVRPAEDQEQAEPQGAAGFHEAPEPADPADSPGPAEPAEPVAPGPPAEPGPEPAPYVPWQEKAPEQAEPAPAFHPRPHPHRQPSAAHSAPLPAEHAPARKTPEQLAAEKKRRERRNINVALYIGGLLLVAAALSFIAVVGDPVLTAVSLGTVCLAFTAGGFLIARFSTVLRPAGISLYGTGLALLPVLALPLDEAIIHDELLTWLVISAAGTAVYLHGAVALDSRILGYLVIPFLYSTVFAATAAVRPALFWALLVVIAVSSVLQLAMALWGSRVPQVLSKPFGQLHVAVVPGVLAAALVMFDQLSHDEFAALFGVAGVYYLASSWQCVTHAGRLAQRIAARPLWLLAAMLLLGDRGMDSLGLLTVLVGIMAVLYLAVSHVPGFTVAQWARADRRFSLLLVLGASALVQLSGLPQGPLDSTGHAWMIILAVITVGVAAQSLLITRDTAPATAPPGWQLAIRGVLVLSLLAALPENIWWTVVWALIWLLGEFALSLRPWRAVWQRAAGAVTVGAFGLALGRALEDPLLGDRLALAATTLFAVACAVLLGVASRRSHQLGAGPRRELGEAWSWAALFIPAAALGAVLYPLGELTTVLHLLVAAAVLYGILVMTSGPAAAVGDQDEVPSTSIARAGAFTGYALIGAIAVDRLYGSAQDQAALLLAGALTLLGAEVLSAVLLRRGGPTQYVPVRTWMPLHLSSNLLWLAVVNAVLAATGGDGALYWATAAPWALSALALLWRADLRVPQRLLIAPALYVAGAAVMMLAGLVSADRPWWAALILGGAGLLLVVLCLRHVSLPPVALTLPACAALSGSLLMLGPLEAADASAGLRLYVVPAAAFLLSLLAGIGTMALSSAQQTRMVLIASTGAMTLLASLVPVITAPAADPPGLGWMVPAMHALLMTAALWGGPHSVRVIAALIGSLAMPASLLFAWGQHEPITATTAAVAVLLMLAGLLVSESLLSRAPNEPHLFLGTGAAVLAVLVVTSHRPLPAGDSTLLLQVAPFAGAAALLTHGLVRGHRGALWAGALLPVAAPVPEEAMHLFWLLPVLHALVFMAELDRSGPAQRAQCCFFGALGLPASWLYAWVRTEELSQVSVSVTLLLMMVTLMVSEFVLAARQELPGHLPEAGGTVALGQGLFFGAGGAVATAAALVSFLGDSILAEVAPLAAAAGLLVCALLRSDRMGLWWAATLIVLSVLWWLRSFTVLLLVTLAVLIIGAAIRRLIVITRREVTSGG